MAAAGLLIDDAPFSAFHRRLTIYSCGGPFCDGYILGIIAIAMGPLSHALVLSPAWQGLIGASAIAGMFIGGSVFGRLTDLVGRQLMYTIDLLVLMIASAAQFWVQDVETLFVLRLILGIAIGADYPIVSALLSEFAPRRQRGTLLATMIGAWWFGYAMSFLVGYALSNAGNSSWRWMLASSAVPAGVVALLRLGTPESPRWLIAKGRIEEARAVITQHLGSGYVLDESRSEKANFKDIFREHYRKRLIFVCCFWALQVIPAFAIYTFAPDLLSALGFQNPNLGAAVMSLFFIAGVVPAIWLVDRIGRRPLLIVPFAVTGITLALLGFAPKMPTFGIAICFVIFAAFNAGSSILQWIYPSELFPTEIRATALGIATSVSRIGAAVGTFLFPIGLLHLGVSNLMLLVSATCFLGWAQSFLSAPETRGLALKETSRIP